MKTYICECGKEFDNPQKFNGHKSHCKIHLQMKGTYEEYQARQHYAIEKWKTAGDKKHQEKQQERQKIKEDNLKTWLSEEHTCERCGKIMTEKYGSGRFCSSSCAHARNLSLESKIKAKNTSSQTKQQKYYLNPKRCKICGSILDWSDRHKQFCQECTKLKKTKTQKSIKPKENICIICNKAFIPRYYREQCCSSECKSKYKSISRKKAFVEGRIKHSAVRAKYKYGTYQGFYCDSSWELAFIVYCLDHNINIKRNTTEAFPYVIDDKEHLYFPDFIVNGVFVELKGRKTEIVDEKIKAIPKQIPYRILFYKDLKNIIKYVTDKYGKNFTETLYDRNYPCYLDKIKNN